jgi:hypothetical protein
VNSKATGRHVYTFVSNPPSSALSLFNSCPTGSPHHISSPSHYLHEQYLASHRQHASGILPQGTNLRQAPQAHFTSCLLPLHSFPVHPLGPLSTTSAMKFATPCDRPHCRPRRPCDSATRHGARRCLHARDGQLPHVDVGLRQPTQRLHRATVVLDSAVIYSY